MFQLGIWQNYCPYQFLIITLPSHTISTYGSDTSLQASLNLKPLILFSDNLTKVKRSMERLVAKKQSENQKQMIKKKTNLFPPSPVIIWIQQGTVHLCTE